MGGAGVGMCGKGEEGHKAEGEVKEENEGAAAGEGELMEEDRWTQQR